jgi:hypothetical protein
MTTLDQLLADTITPQFWFYVAGEDDNGVFCVEPLADYAQDEANLAHLSTLHPSSIYFAVVKL